ncbi:acetolactate synthase [Brevibacterium sp. 5221]|uniref:Acetolactate synthase n=1 Tax=Brevibacterium rongguiense TaxID=2695267 RepID=A0A6N9H6K7_9MICO|nr:thiamine pyrophosphate-dependent enzyme [Brevibacterium rongguiense]MYM19680.1 acetolactate synthase [Brevibacterium rongguiense]
MRTQTDGRSEPVPAAEPGCSAGHLIVRQLERQGVERVYCVPGESYLDVLDGLYDSQIQTVVCRQEGGVGNMAVAEGRLTGLPGVAAVTRGPGAANTMIAVHTAFQDATPLIVLVGLIPETMRGHEAFQEFSLEGWFGTTAKRVFTLDSPGEAADLVARAFHIATSGRPGPVIIGLPEETLLAPTSGRTVPPLPLAATPVSDHQLAAIEDAAARAERPLLVVGGEGWTDEGSAAIAAWAQGQGMGIIADFRATDGIDHDCPAYLGAAGYGSWPGTAEALARADLQVFLGCARADVMTNGFERGMEPAHTIVVNPDAELRQHTGPLDMQVVARTPDFAAAVAGRPARTAELPAWVRETRSAYTAWRQTPSDDRAREGYLDLDVAFASVRELLPDDAVIAYGAGNHSGWASRYLPTHGPASLLGPRNGAMGFGVPAAVAAALVFPDRKVFSIAGDGCFMMNGQEFATAVAHGLDITIIVDDNSVYGTIVGHQEREYPNRPSGTGLQNPDFAEYARAFGGFGIRVERTADFRDAFAQALDYPGPAIVHAIVDPEVRTTRR